MAGPTNGGAPLSVRLLDLGAVDPYVAQTFVEALAPFVAAQESPPTLLIASPRDTYVSLGFHQSYEVELDGPAIERAGLTVIRRVTGGGTTWLDPSQVFYELVYPIDGAFPTGEAAFAQLLAAPRRYLASLGVDARWRPPSDLTVEDRKISGNAGGEWEGAAIVQGGLLGEADTDAMAEILRSPHPAFRDVLAREVREHLTSIRDVLGHPIAPATLRAGLIDAFRREPGWRLVDGLPLPAEHDRFVREVLPRHRGSDWTRLASPREHPTGLPRRVRVAGQRFVVAEPDPDVPGGVLVSVEAEEAPRAVYRAPPAPAYRGIADLVRLL